MTTIAPKNWNASKIERRFSNTGPQSYDADNHSCLAVISTGAAVRRIFGTEILEISESACDLSRLPVPLLDSHNQSSIDNVLGRIDSAWVSGGNLNGKIIFAQTPRGKMAEAMVSRGEINSLSAGYRVDKWSCVDSDGDQVDPERTGWDDDFVFTATQWCLHECSLVGIPADAMATVRSLNHNGDAAEIASIRARMMARQRMAIRQRMMEAQSASDILGRLNGS
jgi:phage head maturation protease